MNSKVFTVSYKLLSMLSLLLAPWENYLKKKYHQLALQETSPIFIIGAPRTGSTILYQVLTNFWDVGYLTNFDCAFHKNILAAKIISNKLFGQKFHNCFTSNYGFAPGFSSPSECGRFWYQWFPRERHFVEPRDLTAAQLQDLRATVNLLVSLENKPFIFKNMNCGQRLRVLVRTLPQSLFLYIVREPLYTAQDLLKVRERLFGDRRVWWSVRPKEYSQLLELDPCEQVVAQIYYLQRQIENDLEELFPHRYLVVHYEDLCQGPERTLENIRFFLQSHRLGIRLKVPYKINFFKLDNVKSIDDESFILLNLHVKKYFS